MSEMHQEQDPTQPDPRGSQVRYTSFLLRCWIGKEGQIHARLIDLRTGLAHVVVSLAFLPELVRRLALNEPAAEGNARAQGSRCLEQIDTNEGG